MTFQLSGEGFSTRPVSLDHLDELLALYRQCEDFLALGPVAQASEEMIRRDLVTTQPEGGSYLAIDAGDPPHLAGVIDIIPGGYEGRAEVAFLELLMLAEPDRGQGLGKRVFAALEDELRRRGARILRAGVQANNPRAIHFWLGRGFRKLGEAEQLPDGTICFALEKALVDERDA